MGAKASLKSACLVLGGFLIIALGGTATAQDRLATGDRAAAEAAGGTPAVAGARAPVQVAQDYRRHWPRNRSHIIGRATAVDGDTIEIRGRRIRIQGIDAFQPRQRCRNNRGRRYRCGRRASAAMQRLVNGERIACVRLGGGRHATLATCWRGSEDLGAAMVLSGWAVATGGPGGPYSIHERMARRRQAGAWSGEFTRPSQWRGRRRDRPRRRRERDD